MVDWPRAPRHSFDVPRRDKVATDPDPTEARAQKASNKKLMNGSRDMLRYSRNTAPHSGVVEHSMWRMAGMCTCSMRIVPVATCIRMAFAVHSTLGRIFAELGEGTQTRDGIVPAILLHGASGHLCVVFVSVLPGAK